MRLEWNGSVDSWPYGRCTMEIAVSPDLEQIVREKVESGHYSSTDEVLREAMREVAEHQVGAFLLSGGHGVSRSGAVP